MPVPTIRSLLKQDRVLLGAWQYIPYYDYTALIAEAGYDFILIDAEHSGRNVESIQHCVLAANAAGVPAIIRVLDKQQFAIEQALDLGAQGVLMPILETVEDAELLVRSARFAPTGERGWCPMQRAGRYGARMDFHVGSDEDIFVAGILETPLAFENLDAILKVPGIDALSPGPGDLSIRMGQPHDSPAVQSLVRSAFRKIVDAGKIAWCAGGLAPPQDDIAGMGIRMHMAGSDTHLLQYLRKEREAITRGIEAARGASK